MLLSQQLDRLTVQHNTLAVISHISKLVVACSDNKNINAKKKIISLSSIYHGAGQNEGSRENFTYTLNVTKKIL